MIAEWEPHIGCVMSWCAARDLYEPEHLAFIHTDQVRLAAAIAAFEPVTMLVHPRDMAEAAQRLSGKATLVEMEVHDIWARDTMSIIGWNAARGAFATGWNFNTWGEKYRAGRVDRTLAKRYADHADLPFVAASITGEGGAFETDGHGTLITTETCLLNPNRNPSKTRAEVEEALRRYAPCRHVIWLHGSDADQVTDGHVDGICRFVRPGVVVAEIIDDPTDPEYPDMQENLAMLRKARDADGNRLEIHVLHRPRWDVMPEHGPDFAPSYVNAYFPNGGVILPEFGDRKRDRAARALFAKLMPDRRIVQIPIDTIAEGGGGIHCNTMQIPAPPR